MSSRWKKTNGFYIVFSFVDFTPTCVLVCRMKYDDDYTCSSNIQHISLGTHSRNQIQLIWCDLVINLYYDVWRNEISLLQDKEDPSYFFLIRNACLTPSPFK